MKYAALLSAQSFQQLRMETPATQGSRICQTYVDNPFSHDILRPVIVWNTLWGTVLYILILVYYKALRNKLKFLFLYTLIIRCFCYLCFFLVLWHFNNILSIANRFKVENIECEHMIGKCVLRGHSFDFSDFWSYGREGRKKEIICELVSHLFSIQFQEIQNYLISSVI